MIRPQATIEGREWRWAVAASTMLLAVISIPFVIAITNVPPGYEYAGVLVNASDGLSYLAKMAQGAAGSWLLHLPYTPEAHNGVFLYPFYLALGHAARLLGLPIVVVYHAMRLVGGLAMFLATYRFIADWTEDVNQRRVTWAIGAAGGGLGWLAILLGRPFPPPVDVLMLPEAYLIQAAFTNAHLPWAIAIGVWMAHALYSVALTHPVRWPRFDWLTFGLVVGTLVLVTVSPFMLALIGIAYGALVLALWLARRGAAIRELVWGGLIAAVGAPLAVYNAWAISPANPVFAAWMAQNITPSWPIWEYVIGFGPQLALAGLAIWRRRVRFEPRDVFLITLTVTPFALSYLPINLQARFLIGFSATISVYAGEGLWQVVGPAITGKLRRLAIGGIFAVMEVTTLFAILIPLALIGSPERAPLHYTSLSENEAMNWLGENANGSVVLASPQLGLFLPIHGLRVVFGHEFETVLAEARLQAVYDFYAGQGCNLIELEGVSYVVMGPREKALTGTGAPCPFEGEVVFTSRDGAVTLYQVDGR